MRTRVFTVTPETWVEHFRAGVAGINDPYHRSQTPPAYATRQKVMTEVAGIRPGDRLFFYVQRTKEIIGGFEVTTKPFFDPSPVFAGATEVDARFPFRVGFKQTIQYPRPIQVNEIWASRDAGQIWTMQQARGDAIGRHACWSLTYQEGELLDQMLQELNVITHNPKSVLPLPVVRQPLPFDLNLDGVRDPHLHYEASLQSLILEGLADGKWRDLLGQYDDFLPFVSTSEGKEIDVVLLRHNQRGEVLWYQLLELKADRYRLDDLLQILAYETWLTSSQAEGNPRAAHMIAVANRYDDDVLRQVATRHRLQQKPVRLLNYQFDQSLQELSLSEITPPNMGNLS
jgi:hypothetical protein